MRQTCACAAVVLFVVSCAACEPIPAPSAESPDPTSTRLAPGDRLPEFLLRDSTGKAVTPTAFLGKVTTLTFVTPDATQPAPFLRRIDDVYDRLGADAISVRRYLVTLPATDDEAQFAERDGWRVLSGDADVVIDLAARFGVLTWPVTGGGHAQTLGVAVVGPDGLIAALLGGLETWEEMDLLAAITRADH